MYTLLVFKENDQYVDFQEGKNVSFVDDLEVHYIQNGVEKDGVWIRMYGIKEFPTFILFHDRKELGKISKINYNSNYDIKSWVYNLINYEECYD